METRFYFKTKIKLFNKVILKNGIKIFNIYNKNGQLSSIRMSKKDEIHGLHLFYYNKNVNLTKINVKIVPQQGYVHYFNTMLNDEDKYVIFD